MANSRLCSIPDCGKPHKGKGFCGSHYERFRAHGDPLAGSTYHGEPLHFLNEVVLKHTGDECLPWPYGKVSKGRGAVKVNDKRMHVSRYVCEIVNGPPPTPDHEAAHNCGNGHLACVNHNHLEWKTAAHNQADRVKHGTHNFGERNPTSKLTEMQVRDIIASKGVLSLREIAAKYQVSKQAIYLIHKWRNWGWLSEAH